MRIKIFELDKEFRDVVLEMGGEINWTNDDDNIDVVFSTKCKVAMVTLDNECIGFSSPKKLGFVVSSSDFRLVEIF